MENYYFVGAVWNGDEDKTTEFLEQGYWEMGWSPADKPKFAAQINQIKPGEWIAIKAVSVQKNNLPFTGVPPGKSVSKMTIKAIGQVASNPQNGKLVYVDWQTDFKVKDWFFFTYRGTFWRINEQGQWWSQYASKLIDFAFNNKPQDYDYFVKNWSWNQQENDMVELNEIEGEHEVLALNTILYGPPGTGKTFNTVDLAWQILNTNDSADTTRPGSIQELKARYPGQVEFVTFHQSFSYEDFVEGIQAKTQDGRISYKVEDGVFKKICIVAQHSRLKKSDGVQDFDFSLIYDQLLQSFREKLPYKIFTKSNKPLLIKAVSEQDSLHIYHEDSEVMHIVGRKRLKKLYESFSTIDTLKSVSNINNEFKEVIGGSNSSAYWAALNKVLHFKQEMSEQKGSSEVEQDSIYLTIEQKKKQLQDVDEADLGIGSPHVLIIDEINRGNISRIFGELITLIEPSKRAGNDEAIEVTLPYSKEPFSVPNNLYIIGTMNTADRSLALMDTALRRRFDFIEMMPQPDLVTEDLEGIDLRKMLGVMNQRIEALYDREHTLGHAFLMKVDSLEDLRRAFKNKILPLLEEYFYDDWQKIRWVLGASADNFYQRQRFTNLFTDADAPNDIEKFQRNNLDDLDAQAFVAIYQS